ncbi:Nop53-domain-containing protein [Saitoella complicata NRRL Y-17804]|nr:Nop53-domain-containing protein [Saitoella complicata NRRL Y-17804]ODQ52332.1 Nop53-domain-containing protein [Saitoella complicata NRRL Y-17804]
MAPVAIDKTVEGKAVVVAKPGQSYNPAIQEWSELVKNAAEIEEERERKRAEEAARKAQIKALAATIIENIVEENSEAEEEQAGDDMDVDQAEKKLPKRKTKAERKKAERAVKRAQDELHQAKLKTQKLQLAQLAAHKKEQLVSTTESAEEKARRAPKRLGPYRLQHEPLELQLSDELAESLRTLKPEGNALRERFVSMQKRGILEVRVPVKERRKYELKDIEKWSYKDWKHTPNRN